MLFENGKNYEMCHFTCSTCGYEFEAYSRVYDEDDYEDFDDEYDNFDEEEWWYNRPEEDVVHCPRCGDRF